MEKYTLDDLVSALLIAGFNKVDTILLKLLNKKIQNDSALGSKLFFTNSIETSAFKNVITYEKNVFEIKGNTAIDYIYYSDECSITFGDILPKKEDLIKYAINEDITDIVLEKANIIGIENLPDNIHRFSNKEIDIIKHNLGKDVFGSFLSFDGNLQVLDYKKLRNDDILCIIDIFKKPNYIYNYCLNDEQKRYVEEKRPEMFKPLFKSLFNSNEINDEKIEETKNEDEKDLPILLVVLEEMSKEDQNGVGRVNKKDWE